MDNKVAQELFTELNAFADVELDELTSTLEDIPTDSTDEGDVPERDKDDEGDFTGDTTDEVDSAFDPLQEILGRIASKASDLQKRIREAL